MLIRYDKFKFVLVFWEAGLLDCKLNLFSVIDFACLQCSQNSFSCNCFVYFLNYVYLFLFRKGRKTSITWVLVSLCTSMLIFNLLFLFGIENSNKYLKSNNNRESDSQMTGNKVPAQEIHDPSSNPTCTVIAAFLHYFLLVTFTWNGLSAAQLYFLLIRTMKPLPQRFILYISLIGWGKWFSTYWGSKFFSTSCNSRKCLID